ncbi:polyadenylate-binding RBP45-like, partial [Olea europaea subsp. europaea]
MQPSNSMIPSPMAPPPQYRPQQWMPQQPQQTQYQVPPPQQPAATAGYYYQQPPQAAPTQQPQPQPQPQPQQYGVSPAAQAPADDGTRSLWIGDLQYWMDEQYIYSCFALTGEVASAKVIRNKQTGQSEGYGFIEFVSHAAAERNLMTYNGTQMPNSEQTFRLNWASMGAGEKHDDTPEYTIFVGDLAADITDYMLQETFRASYSSVKGAKVVTDKITGRTKGYGFVRFGDESEQLHAMTEMNGRYCSTRPMRVGPAANKQKVGGQTKASSFTFSAFSQTKFISSHIFIFVFKFRPLELLNNSVHCFHSAINILIKIALFQCHFGFLHLPSNFLFISDGPKYLGPSFSLGRFAKEQKRYG